MAQPIAVGPAVFGFAKKAGRLDENKIDEPGIDDERCSQEDAKYLSDASKPCAVCDSERFVERSEAVEQVNGEYGKHDGVADVDGNLAENIEDEVVEISLRRFDIRLTEFHDGDVIDEADEQNGSGDMHRAAGNIAARVDSVAFDGVTAFAGIMVIAQFAPHADDGVVEHAEDQNAFDDRQERQ